jgi:GT2 family glycosyltransferase
VSVEVSAIIVSYNTREMTLQCLAALKADLRDTAAEIFVVDNASGDNSVAAIRAAHPAVHVIENKHNKGFGAANNQAMRQATGEFLLLLNSDAFPKSGAIRALIDHLKSHSDHGLVGPRLLNEDGTLQRSCYRFPSPTHCWRENLWMTGDDYSDWPHDSLREVEWVTGACLLVRRRFHDSGFKIAFTPTAEVVHKGGGSGANEPARINQHFFQSLDAYQLKHHGIAGLISLRMAMIVGCSLRALLWTAASAVFIARGGKADKARTRAVSKIRLHTWLIVRQLTHWRIGAF